jgi:type II secretory ATPase GspE/PulE/Tfp pilus assembly ATPase PilB-like protein
MQSTQTTDALDIESKLNEAETYRSMGLLEESVVVYEDILSQIPELAPSRQEDIREKIDALQREIEDLDRADADAVTAEDIALVKETLAISDDVSAIMESAASFKELGLYREALAEYERLLGQEYSVEECIPDIVACLLKAYPPRDLIEQVDKFGGEALQDKDRAEIKAALGAEMEKRDQKETALDLYRSAQETDSENEDVKERVDAILSSISSSSKYDYLINQKIVTPYQLQQALAQSKKTKKSVDFMLLESFKVKKGELGKSLALFYACPFRAYDPELATPVELIANLKKPFLLNALWVPLRWGKEGVEILIDDPRDLSKTDQVRALLKTGRINFSVGIKEDIVAFIRRFFDARRASDAGRNPEITDADDLIPDISFEEEEESEDEQEIVDEKSTQVVRLVDQILITAYRKNVSDVHIEPVPDAQYTNIRFRMDGVCQDYMKVPISMARGFLSRVKVMARLDIAERRLPQDGKIKFRRKGIAPFELRLATLPTPGGYEDAVLRILSHAGALSLEELALSENNLKVMKKMLAQPYGLVLAAGPTGSGKTTTLHSALGYINKPGIKIWTAEDPVEVSQRGLRQVEVKPEIGLNFARVMRAFLRADPDVIMIGEMRDEETAAISIEASLTGHLVFSTLHTNNSAETVTRLLDMGFNPINFSDAFLGVVAQRLVRRLCEECRKGYQPSQEEFDEIVTEYGEAEFETTGITLGPDLTLYRPEGCETCSGTGYNGRLAIHEVMEGTNEIKRLIKKQATSETISDQARSEGLRTLRQDGISKAFEGSTDIGEVRRVCIH